jgi:L-asparaginase II
MAGWSTRNDRCSTGCHLPSVLRFHIFVEIGKCALDGQRVLAESDSRIGGKRSQDDVSPVVGGYTCNGRHASMVCCCQCMTSIFTHAMKSD